MDKPIIEATHESVKFEGCSAAGNIIFRPKTMSAMQWLEFWETIQTMELNDSKKAQRELDEANEEIALLKAEISDLEQRIFQLENEP